MTKMAGKAGGPDSGARGESSERGHRAAGVAIAGGLLVAVLALLMGGMLVLLWVGVPLWPSVAVVVVLCGVAVVVVRRVVTPVGEGGDGWFGRLVKVAVMLGAGSGASQ